MNSYNSYGVFYRQEQLRDIEDCIMVGVFPQDEDFDLLYKNDVNIKVLDDGVIRFYIKAISDDPEKVIEMDLSEPPLWMGRSSISFKPGLLQLSFFTARNPDDQLQILKEKLSGKIILFKPRLNLHPSKQYYLKHLVITDIISDVIFDENSYFVPVPRPAFPTREKFELAIQEQREIKFPRHNNEMIGPEIVFYDNYIYCLDVSAWKKGSSKHSRIYGNPDNVKKINKPVDFNQHIIQVDDHLVFIEKNYKIKLEKQILESNQLEPIMKKLDSLNSSSNIQEAESPEKSTVSEFVLDSKVNPIQAKASQSDRQPSSMKFSDDEQIEENFLKHLGNLAMLHSLYYDKADLQNFHISVKTNALTVLAGMSGTGKTRLAELYAKALNLNRDEGYIIVPVSPSYTEPTDILGFLNLTTGIYTPAETGLVDLLLRARDNPDQIFMVIFDEMNLSQIEHWFSPFISILEMDEKVLHLYGKDSICHNKAQYPSQIPVYDNVVFVGTANVDETTKDFSDRLLDRANVLKLRQLKFSEIRAQSHRSGFAETKTVDFESLIDTMTKMPLAAYFRKWCKKVESPFWGFTDEEISFLEELHDVINRFDGQKGVSLRIFRDIEEYLANIPIMNGNPCFSRQTAMDFQIKQRVMPKIRGHEEQFGALIGRCNTVNYDDIQDSEMKTLLDKYCDKVSDFSECKKELIRKARAMFFNGYTS